MATLTASDLSLKRASDDAHTSPASTKHNTILTDHEALRELLCGNIEITPIISNDQIGPAVDLRLGNEFVVKRMDRLPDYDPISMLELVEEDPNAIDRFYHRIVLHEPSVPFILHPGELALGSTLEYIALPDDIGALLEGRSSWAREGLNVHSTAGIIHPGHKGVIVFELQNLGMHPLSLYAGTRVAQLLFYRVSSPLARSYSTGARAKRARYNRATETAYGKPWKDWEFEIIRRKQKDMLQSKKRTKQSKLLALQR
jgi:dCTP deaminase